MINYKDIFQLAQDKGFSSCIDDQRTPNYLKVVEIQRWLREDHEIAVVTKPIEHEVDAKTVWGYSVLQLEWGFYKEHHSAAYMTDYKKELTYDKAFLEGINEALKLIKN